MAAQVPEIIDGSFLGIHGESIGNPILQKKGRRT
jgi:hypothetical protein